MKKPVLLVATTVALMLMTACSEHKANKTDSGDIKPAGLEKTDAELFTENLQSKSWWNMCESTRNDQSRRDEVKFMAADDLMVITEHTWSGQGCEGEPSNSIVQEIFKYQVSDANEMGRVINFWNNKSEQYGRNDLINVRGDFKDSLVANIDGEKLSLSEGEITNVIGTEFNRIFQIQTEVTATPF